MGDDRNYEKKPVIDWHQVYICNGFDMVLYDKINSGIISVETLKNEHKLNES